MGSWVPQQGGHNAGVAGWPPGKQLFPTLSQAGLGLKPRVENSVLQRGPESGVSRGVVEVKKQRRRCKSISCYNWSANESCCCLQCLTGRLLLQVAVVKVLGRSGLQRCEGFSLVYWKPDIYYPWAVTTAFISQYCAVISTVRPFSDPFTLLYLHGEVWFWVQCLNSLHSLYFQYLYVPVFKKMSTNKKYT